MQPGGAGYLSLIHILAFLSATCREEFNLTELFREPLLCIVPQDWPEPPNGIMTPELMNEMCIRDSIYKVKKIHRRTGVSELKNGRRLGA